MGISRTARRACVLGAAAFVAVAGCSFPDHQFLPVDQFNRLKDGGATGGSAGVGGSITGGSGGVAGSGGVGGIDAGGSGGVAGSGGASGSGGTAGSAGNAGTGGSGGTAGAGGVDGGAGTGGTAGSGGSTGGSGGSDAGTCTGPVVINEVATDGSNGSDEFVELYNKSNCTVDLLGWRLDYTSASGLTKNMWTGKSGDSLLADGYFVLAGLGFTGNADFQWGSGYGLAKGGGGVALYDPTGASPVDSMAWETVPSSHVDIEGTACANIPTLKSASRIPNGQDTNDNSVDFTVGTQRTPGAKNLP